MASKNNTNQVWYMQTGASCSSDSYIATLNFTILFLDPEEKVVPTACNACTI